MERDLMLDRLHQLEREVELLRAEIEPASRSRKFFLPIQRLTTVVTQHWVLFSLLAALATALYAKYEFDIDYTEDYRNIAITKEISKFYREVGDRMMANTEWKAAEDAYRSSLDVNPNNKEAAYGLVKAQVFQPLQGEKYFAPGVVEAKLDSLLKEFPEDYQVLFLKGTYYLNLGDYGKARIWLEDAICKNKDFVGSYLQMGIVEQQSANLDKAIGYFEVAREKDSNDDAIANNNLGYLHLLKLDFGKSVWHLKRAYSLSRSVLTLINLGDAYLFLGDYRTALQMHVYALEALNQPGVENERHVAGQWYYNTMPLQWEISLARNDLFEVDKEYCSKPLKQEMPLNQENEEPVQYNVSVVTLQQKQAIVHYRLSFDYALNGDFESADREFQTAQSLDLSHQYNTYFIFHIQSIINLRKLDGDVKGWFESQWNTLFLQLS